MCGADGEKSCVLRGKENFPKVCRPDHPQRGSGEPLARPPRHGDRSLHQAGGEDDGQVGAAVETDFDFLEPGGDIGGHADQIAEDLAGLGVVAEVLDEGIGSLKPLKEGLDFSLICNYHSYRMTEAESRN